MSRVMKILRYIYWIFFLIITIRAILFFFMKKYDWVDNIVFNYVYWIAIAIHYFTMVYLMLNIWKKKVMTKESKWLWTVLLIVINNFAPFIYLYFYEHRYKDK